MRDRAPEEIASLATAIGTDLPGINGRIADLAGHRRPASLAPIVLASMR
jgi:hypothetical protein